MCATCMRAGSTIAEWKAYEARQRNNPRAGPMPRVSKGGKVPKNVRITLSRKAIANK
jgi:predicted Fe-S protein YdhL (DUF1289 family)